MSKKIFITGCAKSGTTLLLRMCYAFKDTEVIYKEGFDGHEMDFDKFIKHTNEKKFTIGKRHPPALLSNVLVPNFQDQAEDIIKEQIAVINVVRDGRDVVLSDGNYVKPRRWIESIDQRDKKVFGNLIDLEVKYEDLVTDPEKIQRQMEQKFGLESDHSFKDYPDYVEDWVFEWNVSVLARAGKGNDTDYGKREVDTRGIGKDLEAYKDLCSDLELPKFEKHFKGVGLYMRALVTGDEGYIGGNFVQEWEKRGHTWIGYDYKSNWNFDLSHGIKELYLDHQNNPIDVVVHFAAIPRVAFSVEYPSVVMKNNILSTTNVLKWAKVNEIPVIYSSSSSVVGNGDGPASPYALSKYVGEMETLLYNKLYDLKTVALRYFNVYSYDQEADSEYATVVCNWKKYIQENRVPFITGDGEQRRDMTHVDDIVSANIFCAENIDKDEIWGHWYDIGSGQNISLNELKEIVLQYFPEQQFKYVEPRPGDVMFTEADLSKFKKHGWESKVDLKEGLNLVYKTLKEELGK